MTIEMQGRPAFCVRCGRDLGWTLGDVAVLCIACNEWIAPTSQRRDDDMPLIPGYESCDLFAWRSPPCGCRDVQATLLRRRRDETSPADEMICGRCGTVWTRADLATIARDRRRKVETERRAA